MKRSLSDEAWSYLGVMARGEPRLDDFGGDGSL